jgi:hypothetical protein
MVERKSRRVNWAKRVRPGIFIQSTPNQLQTLLSIGGRAAEGKTILASRARQK